MEISKIALKDFLRPLLTINNNGDGYGYGCGDGNGDGSDCSVFIGSPWLFFPRSRFDRDSPMCSGGS
jgi:hypothetical protein